MRRLVRYFLMLTVILVCWVSVLAVLSFWSKPGEALAIVAMPGNALKVVAQAGGSLESKGGPLLLTRSNDPDFVWKLYRSGALLVIDGRVVLGCRKLIDGRDS